MGKADILADLQRKMNEIVGGDDSAPDGILSTGEPARPHSPKGRAAEKGELDPADADAAFRKIVDLVNASDKSEVKIRERLERIGFNHQAIDTSVGRAKGYGFIDDLRYADVLVRSRVSQGKGSRGIERELWEQNIDVGDLQGWPYEYGIDDDSEFSRAMKLLERKPPHAKNLREAAYRKLVTKGFSTSIASSAAREWFENYSR